MSDLIVSDSLSEINNTSEPTRYVEKRLAHLDALYAQIEAYEARAKDLREHANSQAAHFIAAAPSDDERKELASAIYWEREFIKSLTVCNAMGAYPQQITKFLYPGIASIPCRKCGADVEVVVNSRTDRQYKTTATCQSCQQIEAQENEVARQEYRQHEAQYNQYIQQLKTMPYAEYLKTDHWQNMRRKMLKRAGFSCQLCNASGTSLHVHHRTYERRGQENYSDLIVLCAGCHETFHTNGVLS